MDYNGPVNNRCWTWINNSNSRMISLFNKIVIFNGLPIATLKYQRQCSKKIAPFGRFFDAQLIDGDVIFSRSSFISRLVSPSSEESIGSGLHPKHIQTYITVNCIFHRTFHFFCTAQLFVRFSSDDGRVSTWIKSLTVAMTRTKQPRTKYITGWWFEPL